MDSLTHIALGAIIGEAALSKDVGKKALLIGAIAQSLPDIDVIAKLWLPVSTSLLVHRGFTHSLLFGIIAGLLLAFFLNRLSAFRQVSLMKLFLFLCLQIWLHELLDACNAYGTGLLEPFSHERFSFHIIFVGDPFFSISLLIAFFALLLLKADHPARKKWLFAGIIPAAVYFLAAISHKRTVDNQARQWLQRDDIAYNSVIVTPTPFNSWLWFVIASTDTGYYAGYRSVYDNEQYPLSLTFYPTNAHLLKGIDSTKPVKELLRFADHYYTVENRNDSLIFNVLRFGQVFGWRNQEAKFIFRYYLNPGFNNSLVVQRGRFTGWNNTTLRALYYRIKGY